MISWMSWPFELAILGFFAGLILACVAVDARDPGPPPPPPPPVPWVPGEGH